MRKSSAAEFLVVVDAVSLRSYHKRDKIRVVRVALLRAP